MEASIARLSITKVISAKKTPLLIYTIVITNPITRIC